MSNLFYGLYAIPLTHFNSIKKVDNLIEKPCDKLSEGFYIKAKGSSLYAVVEIDTTLYMFGLTNYYKNDKLVIEKFDFPEQTEYKRD